MKQYRNGLTAVVDRCVYISYSRYHSVPKSFLLLLFWSRLVHDLAMHATLAALGTLPRSMSLCAPGPGGRHASRVLWCSFQTAQSTAPGLVAVLVETRACCPRDACYPGCARHLTPLYVPVSPWARSATCKPCPMVLVPDSTVHCSRPPARNLDLSSSDHALGPWVGFMYIYYHAMLLT